VLLFGAFCAGACGYVPKGAGPRRVVDALKGVLAGDVALPAAAAALVAEEFRARSRLPADERRRHDVLAEVDWRVLDLLAEGLAAPAIASRLCLRPDRVRVAVASIVAKTGARREPAGTVDVAAAEADMLARASARATVPPRG